jgi:hypothetical protein
MVHPPPHWYPDPTTRHELRFWDGARWTEHVVSAGRQQVDPLTTEPLPGAVPAATSTAPAPGPVANAEGRRAPVLGGLGLLLCVLAVVAVAVPGIGFVRTTSDDGVRLGRGPHHLVLAAHRTYGIFVDDADNSGYSESCSAVDEASGREIRMRNPGWSISSSDTEVLDLVFDTGAGKVSLTCAVGAERVTVRPVPHYGAMLLGVVAGGILGTVGLGMLVAWAAIRFARVSGSGGPRPQSRQSTGASGSGS